MSKDEPTMADVWLTLSHSERKEIADVVGVDLPVLALTKISSVMKPLINTRIFMNCTFDKPVSVTGDKCTISHCMMNETVTLYGNNHSFVNNNISATNGPGINIAALQASGSGAPGSNNFVISSGNAPTMRLTEIRMRKLLWTIWPSLLGFGFTLIALAAILALRLNLIEF